VRGIKRPAAAAVASTCTWDKLMNLGKMITLPGCDRSAWSGGASANAGVAKASPGTSANPIS